MSGWGSGKWGSSKWGWAPGEVPAGAPIIYPLDPEDEEAGVAQRAVLYIRLADDIGVGLTYLQVVVGGQIWVIGGVAVNGASFTATANAFNGYDVAITPPAAYPFGSRQEVLVTVRDSDDQTTTLVYHFMVGVGPRLVRVRNPIEGALRAYFNRPMRIDSGFLSPANWVITPVSAGAAPMTITAVVASTSQPDVAHLRYTGGGSTYRLTASNVVSLEGDELEQDSAEFELVFDEQESPKIRFFNSVYGPLGISQRVRTRRSIDDHVAGRSIALALDEQLRLRVQQMDGTVGRDGRPGKRRT